jgi:superfamily I DNA/RNA helicase
VNPGSNADLARVINTPTRGIGKVTLLKVIEEKRSEITGATLKKVEAFDTLMMDIAATATKEKLSETLKFIMKRTGMEEMYKTEKWNKVVLAAYGLGLSWGSIACDLSKTRFYNPINKE